MSLTCPNDIDFATIYPAFKCISSDVDNELCDKFENAHPSNLTLSNINEINYNENNNTDEIDVNMSEIFNEKLLPLRSEIFNEKLLPLQSVYVTVEIDNENINSPNDVMEMTSNIFKNMSLTIINGDLDDIIKIEMIKKILLLYKASNDEILWLLDQYPCHYLIGLCVVREIPINTHDIRKKMIYLIKNNRNNYNKKIF